MLALAKGNIKIAEYLISRGAIVDHFCHDGRHTLHFAAQASKTTEGINLILKHSPQSLILTDDEDQTPIEVAAECGNLDNVKCLIQHGVDPHADSLRSE
eukprot:UN07178